ncbi:N-acetylneuraminate 7-O(or 9-O)-acetyltransferase [Aureococcus anophagefferens]|nr:N-acetylneuraminate 7-O(or 9-O)-acetyltransferase [Aureococcus anophagefferens]
MMGKRRMEENTMKLLHHYVEDSSRLQIAAQSEISIPQRRRAAQALRLATEAQIKGIQDERALAAKRHELEVHQSQALAGELERRQAERERREREVQRICGESEELKELELKLKMECDRRAALETEHEKAGSKKEVLLKQKAALQEQMADRLKLAEEARLEAERDRELVEAVVRKIIAEDTRELDERSKRKDECRALIKQYEAQRRRELAEKKARDKAAFERIVAETEKHRAEEEELQALRDLLWEEEMEAQRRKEEQDREAKRQQNKRDMALANEEMLVAKQKQREVERKEEQRLVETMRHKFAEDERNERLIADRRAADKAKYIEAVKLQKIERQEVYERAKAAEMEENGNALKSEEYRLRVVQEARRRLLLEHADELQGFLPKGTIQPEDDFFFAKTQAA